MSTSKTVTPRENATVALCRAIAVWLTGIGTHNIYDSRPTWESLRTAVREAVKHELPARPLWPEHTTKDTARAIRARGLGGELNLAATTPNAYGWEIAEGLANYFTTWEGSAAMGRGSRFRDAAEALRLAGAESEATV